MANQIACDGWTNEETDVEYSSEAGEDLRTRAGGCAVTEVGRRSSLEGGQTSDESFDDGCNYEKSVAVEKQGKSRGRNKDESEVTVCNKSRMMRKLLIQ